MTVTIFLLCVNFILDGNKLKVVIAVKCHVSPTSLSSLREHWGARGPVQASYDYVASVEKCE